MNSNSAWATYKSVHDPGFFPKLAQEQTPQIRKCHGDRPVLPVDSPRAVPAAQTVLGD